MRNSLDLEFWRDELGYIRSVDFRNPGEAFNHSPDVFARYCDMQANSARKDGCGDIANEINGIAVAALMAARGAA